MRLASRVLFLLALCLIAITLPAVPAQAVCVAWDIELSPESGPPGTEVEIYGHDFADGRPIDIYYDGALVSEGTETDRDGGFRIIIRIPDDCSGRYHVHADVGYCEADAYFRVRPGLTVSPDNGPPGSTVTIGGKGFASNEDGIELLYYLNDSYETIETDITANAKGSWEATCLIPTSTRGEHKIDAQGAISHPYDVEEAIFQVTAGISLDESSGMVGETVTVTGSRFATYEKGIQVLFDDQAVAADIKANSAGEWEASFEVPEMPAGEHSVTAEGDQTGKEDVGVISFELEPDIALSCTEGYVGTNLTVTGHGFAANEDVNIIYDGGSVATAETNHQGSFETSFPVPKSQFGEHQVAAGYSGENRASAIFTMESNHPDRPRLISPSNGSRIGLMGSETPTFEWSAVSDDSGVHYRLQVATSDDITATGEFVEPIISIPGLTATTYTLNETQALPLDRYYWIVKAVDEAQNESGWSAPHSFRVGLLPLWALIIIIVAIVVLISAAIRAAVVRRTIYYDHW
jgi:hypothetical protein